MLNLHEENCNNCNSISSKVKIIHAKEKASVFQVIH